MSKTKSQLILRFGLITVALIILGAIGYRMYQIQAEKRDFTKAEASIDALAQQIEQTIGKPDKTKKEKTCSYADRKFEKGPLSCGIKIFLAYKNIGVDRSNNILDKVSPLAGTVLSPRSGKITNRFVETSIGSSYQLFQQGLTLSTELSCVLEYLFPGKSYLDNPIQLEHDENLLLVLSCRGSAGKEHFPIRN